MHGVSDCPTADTLQRFLLGQFPSAEVERLAGHVESCARCVAALQALHPPDGLLQALETPPAEAIPGLGPLMARLCALQPPAFVSDTSVSGGLLARAGTAPPKTPRIATITWPQQQAPGELGQLGDYRILHVLGTGGMGVVFHAYNPQLQRSVALKTLKPVLAASSSARQRFLREAQAIAGLAHDHIVTILHVGKAAGQPFLAMPLLQGETLDERLKHKASCRWPRYCASARRWPWDWRRPTATT